VLVAVFIEAALLSSIFLNISLQNNLPTWLLLNQGDSTMDKKNAGKLRSPALSILTTFPTAFARAAIFMLSIAFLLIFVNSSDAIAQELAATNQTRLSVTNRCDFPVWMATEPNAQKAPLSEGTVKLSKGESRDYSIAREGWAGRLWSKTGCDSNGRNCAAGEAVPPCPPSGCQPPADTKVEFYFPNISSTEAAWYDISLVDGYSLPMEIQPRGGESGSCIKTTCNLSLNNCPQDETLGLGNLGVFKDGKVVQCLAPCKRWNYPAPYGLGKPETEAPGIDLCCPYNDVNRCRTGPVVQTKFVQTVRKACPTAYSYAYDDEAGLHSCSTPTSFDVTLCP
jgi:Thaumatin family